MQGKAGQGRARLGWGEGQEGKEGRSLNDGVGESLT